jgi:hypothetical protein
LFVFIAYLYFLSQVTVVEVVSCGGGRLHQKALLIIQRHGVVLFQLQTLGCTCLIFRVQENDSAKETDPWWEFTAAVDEFSKQ